MIPVLFVLTILSSSIYISGSGFVQPSSILLLLCCFLFVFRYFPRVLYSNAEFLGVVYFLTYSVIVNLVWSVTYPSISLSAFQQAFNLLLFISCYVYFRNIKLSDIRILNYGFLAIIFTYFVLPIFGVGRYTFSPRYNGFFNDPNQMTYWLLCVFIMTLIFGSFAGLKRTSFTNWTAWLMTFSNALLFTKSRAGLLGILFSTLSLISTRVFLLLIIILGMFSWLYLIHQNFEQIALISRFTEVAVAEQIDERGILKPLEHIEYLFFGAGHGEYRRFGMGHEVHSSISGSILYYGLPATTVLLCSIALGRGTKQSKVGVLALLVYGIATYGFRTPIFWITIACALGLRKNINLHEEARCQRPKIANPMSGAKP